MKKGFKFTMEREGICEDCSSPFRGLSAKRFRCNSCQRGSEYKTHMLDYRWRITKLVAMAKNRALTKNLPFNLTKDYVVSLWEHSHGLCTISGRAFDLTSFGKKGQVNPNAPSIDRIVPELGYVEGNVRIVTYHVNVSLSEFGLQELIKLATEIVAYK